MANILCMAAAHSNSIFVAAADRVGTERGQPFIGQSLIVSYTGWPIGGPASYDREEIVYAEANLADALRGASAIGTSTTRSCAIAAAMFTRRCWARMRIRAGTEAAGPGGARTTTKGRLSMKRTVSRPRITRRTALRTIGATTALATSALAAPAIIRRASAQDPIRVGVISPLTGAWTVYGKAHSAGFQMAVDEINEKAGCWAARSRSCLATPRPSPGSWSSRRTA